MDGFNNRGVIDGSNNLLRKIASGLEKVSDESISVVRFLTNTKGDLPHYLFIFRNPDSLGRNNVACSRLGNIFYLEIK